MKKIVFFIAELSFFNSHFKARAFAASQAGYQVILLTKINIALPADLGFIHLIHPININRKSINPFRFVYEIYQVLKFYNHIRPDVVHNVALKPIVLGSAVCKVLSIRNVVNAIVGRGYVYNSNRLYANLLRPIIDTSLKLFLNPPGSVVIFENYDDFNFAKKMHWIKSTSYTIIKGAGVDLSLFDIEHDSSFKVSPYPVVALISRMLWDKGVREFVEAANILKDCGAKFLLIGGVDPDNRSSVPVEFIEHWKGLGVIDWLGYRDDVPYLLKNVSISCLPSYGEGLPKSLLESMAAGVPCVTTDVPGCRELVKHMVNGLIVPPQDATSLASAINLLLTDQELSKQLGIMGRKTVETEFTEQLVNEQTLNVYSTFSE